MSKKVTMAQIAAAAGVSQPTVSLVLNGAAESARITAQTQRKVLEAAQRLGYQRLNRPMSDGSRRIALVLDGSIITNDHFITALNEANERANELGLTLCQLDTAGNDKGRALVRAEINSGLYAGVIIATNVTSELMSDFASTVPQVYLNCIPRNNFEVCAILPDDYGASYELASALAPRYRHPLIVAGDEWMRATSDRCRAIRDAYLAEGIEIDGSHIIYTSWSFKDAFTKTVAALTAQQGTLASKEAGLSSGERPDVILCGSDFLATAVYQAIYYAGLKIPQDIAVAGFDDQPLASNLVPELTTVELPYAQMGALAVDMLLQGMTQPEASWRKIQRIKGQLMLRAST